MILLSAGTVAGAKEGAGIGAAGFAMGKSTASGGGSCVDLEAGAGPGASLSTPRGTMASGRTEAALDAVTSPAEGSAIDSATGGAAGCSRGAGAGAGVGVVATGGASASPKTSCAVRAGASNGACTVLDSLMIPTILPLLLHVLALSSNAQAFPLELIDTHIC